MDDVIKISDEIENILKNHIKVETKVMAVDSLFGNMRFQNKIVFNPYYQRKYVWDSEKGTYFIESILLGTEIPPLVFFNTSDGKIEIIDGRQRYETIKKFLNDQIVLTKQGLDSLRGLAKKKYSDLENSTKDLLLDTKLRIIEFTIVNEPKLTERQEDLIKKEIFRRYNSGITPLKAVEINRAKYNHDDVTNFFKNSLLKNEEHKIYVEQLFFNEKNKNISVDTIMDKIRRYLVIHKVPVKYFSKSNNRRLVIEKLYEIFMLEIEEPQYVYNDFIKKILNLHKFKTLLDNNGVRYNVLMFECIIWGFYICDTEDCCMKDFEKDEEFYNGLMHHISKDIDKYTTVESHFYKNYEPRYYYTLEYFANYINKPHLLEVYIESQYKKIDFKYENIESEDIKGKINELQDLRIKKPEPSSITVDELGRQMLRGKHLIRPSYQRDEVINILKSSAIIESILLDIKLPPIFIYKRKDGVSEVIDGQQRLLSILGYVGQGFRDENGKEQFSKKNKFKLKGLRVLKDEIEGDTFLDLPINMQEKILDFNLAVVEIDEDKNPNFNPIDLFIRLNNKPYPIKDNTFEMWNSYIDKDIITKLKELTLSSENWFYFRKNNKRMDNEEMMTSLAYLFYKKEYDECSSDNGLNIYQKGNRINFRIPDKKEITKILVDTSASEEIKSHFLKSIKLLDSFIKKLELILIDQDLLDKKRDDFLKDELNKLFQIKANSSRRSLQDLYSLWYILSPLNINMIKQYREKIKEDISVLFIMAKDVPEDSLEYYKQKVNEFNDLYISQKRKLKLNYSEVVKLIKMQNNTCPICRGSLYIGDLTHNDHIKAIAIGGSDTKENIQVVHSSCNLNKGIKENYQIIIL
ncbi:GmrSD restriction endonuclease domain-containing protein [Clostridium sartagoforme]|uniref:GmrSD restriction endonuclease domain-containing protein n=1 Tax=Clostridium sartagoforme TaxID=84031 RepID=UPI0031D6B0FA